MIVPALNFQRLHKALHPEIPLLMSIGTVSCESAGLRCSHSCPVFEFHKSHQPEMTERRHRPALDHAHIGSPFGPASESAPAKFRPPSEPANDRLQQSLDEVPQAGIRTDAAE